MVQLSQAIERVGRKTRSPQHPFQVRSRPFSITPFFLAPVLPGETMKKLTLQSRVVSDPIKNPLVGWWIEYYFFYVKHRDLDDRAALEQMVLDPAWSPAAIDEPAASVPYYHAGNGINWAKLCMKRVVAEYFRNEGEAWDLFLNSDGYPVCSISGPNWMDSLVADDQLTTVDDVTIPVDAVPTPDVVYASDVERALQHWSALRMAGLTDQSYEDYLATYGIRSAPVELHKPELVRFVRDWTYPSNTIDPGTGAASSAVSWSIAERADKDRFFREPGFLFGVSIARPKVYFAHQIGSASVSMQSAYAWLPAVLGDDPRVGQVQWADGQGPLAAAATGADGYWHDVRDLLVYGEQFINFALGTVGAPVTDASLVYLPVDAANSPAGVDLHYRWLSADADLNRFFTNAAPLNQVRQDGMVSLSILGRTMDGAPGRNMGTV